MTTTTSAHLDHIHSLLAERGYEVSEPAADTLKITELKSGISVRAVLQADIVFFSLVCTVVPEAAIAPAIMRDMLAAENGISTSYFQLYAADGGGVAVTLNNFCKLEDMGPDDTDEILSCVHFLLADVIAARRLLTGLES